MPRKYTPEQRIEHFWLRVDKSGGEDACWLWTSCRFPCGYGQTRWESGYGSAHRISWMLANGDPGSLFVLHRCDNRQCVNPKHLFLGTRQDNTEDMLKKSRQAQGERVSGAKITWEIASEIRQLAADGKTQRSIAKLFSISQGNVSNIVNNATWKIDDEATRANGDPPKSKE